MMRSRGNRIGAFRYHSGTGYITDNFGTGKMPADTGFSTLPHFNLNCGSGIQIFFVYAKTSGSHLNNSVLTITIKIFVKSAFPGVI